jgi:hypothetical protein
MSISNLLIPNNYSLYCNSINVNGSIYPGLKGSTRVSVNPASNPDPIIGGLVIPAGSGQISMPITVTGIEIGLASPYLYDPKSIFTIQNDTIKIKPGRYSMSFLINVLSYDPMAVQAEGKIVQFLKSDIDIFMGAPICACAMFNGYPLTSPLVAYDWCISSSACFSIDTETEFALKFEFNNTTDVTIVLTSGFSIFALD